MQLCAGFWSQSEGHDVDLATVWHVRVMVPQSCAQFLDRIARAEASLLCRKAWQVKRVALGLDGLI